MASRAFPHHIPRQASLARWVPRQPGSWAMVLAPAMVGTVSAGLSGRPFAHTIAMALLISWDWVLCYCTQYALSRWILSPAGRRSASAWLGWTLATVICGCATLVAAPGLLRWAPIFAVLCAVSLSGIAVRHSASGMVSQTAGIIASCLIPGVLPSAVDPAAAVLPDGMAWWHAFVWWPPQAFDAPLFTVAAMMFAYEFGSLLFVRSMIRRFGDHRYRQAAILWHVGILLAAMMAAYLGVFTRPWAAILAALVLTARVGVWDAANTRQRPPISRLALTECVSVVLTSICTVIACMP